MIVMSPARTNERITIQGDLISDVIDTIGTDRYDRTCFDAIEQAVDVDHWVLYRFRRNNSVSCIATHSRQYTAAAKDNVGQYQERCYKIDPAFLALKKTLQSTCVTKLAIGDIRDAQYRHCFEMTHVQERLSFFSRVGSDIYQLSAFRGGKSKRTFSQMEIDRFSALSNIILATAAKHEAFLSMTTGLPHHLDLDSIERMLEHLPATLSDRERQVCARVVAGMSIEGTALDLNIKRTSVITYRQRSYEKLGVSRQNELVALVNNLRPDAGAAARLS
jgi:DNA-binding CsgD family transcriptional regulator